MIKRITAAVMFALAMSLGLAGCTTHAPLPADHTIDYEKYGILRLKVNSIQVIEEYRPPRHAPHVEHELFLPPYIAMRDWAKHRFQAVGNMGTARIYITDASIIQTDTPVRDDMLGFANNSVETDFNIRLAVKIEINSTNFIELPYAEAVVTRKLHYPWQTTVEDKDKELQSVLAEAINNLDAELTKTIYEKWGNIAE